MTLASKFKALQSTRSFTELPINVDLFPIFFDLVEFLNSEMLPSRLFRNTGIAPHLRSLLTPSPTLPASISVQLRFHLAVRYLSSSTIPSPPPSQPNSSASSASSSQPSGLTTSQSIPLESLEPRLLLSLTFTCTVPNCGERSTHQFTKQAYEKGIVLVECPGCKNRHLIADHLGWFKESTEGGKLRTVEDLVRARGEKVRRGSLGAGGDIEYTPDE
ncbi:hypothetical protein EW146_g6560 [Bondarzewia mesenterica]|uniref:DNL-type domain-containing protein n=1 Tax=Bondarzewia mesenterica TaxID=1095465 RepID=A0A4S4LND7_9AGAM|nr:hypothetical protein EW146_g6560 [Bondarzewia mesenterica]